MKPKYYIFDPNENKWFALFDLDQALAAYVLYSCNDARYTIEVPDQQTFKYELERRKLMVTDAFRWLVVDDHEDYPLDFKMPIKDRDLALFNSLVTVLYTVIEKVYGESVINLSINENKNFDLKIKPLSDDLSAYPKILFENVPYMGFLIDYFFKIEADCKCI